MGPAARIPPAGRTALGLLLAVVAVALLWWAQGDARAPSSEQTDAGSGLPVVRLDDLPPEAAEALERIERGGPFPYDEDDGVFENREDLLPDRPLGHYREYTVGGRPGDRGPLRIVAGDDGERYWTDDHYRSFSEIEVDR